VRALAAAPLPARRRDVVRRLKTPHDMTSYDVKEQGMGSPAARMSQPTVSRETGLSKDADRRNDPHIPSQQFRSSDFTPCGFPAGRAAVDALLIGHLEREVDNVSVAAFR
jgi:hypothetical protein